MTAAVFSYNRKGDVQAVQFFDVDGKLIELGWMEAICDDPGLAVRSTPEQTTDDRLARLAAGMEAVDPKAVPAPAGMGDLAAVMGDA
jgi:hypothetical protein